MSHTVHFYISLCRKMSYTIIILPNWSGIGIIEGL